MKKIYFTIVCSGKFFGYEIFEKDQAVSLRKEPDNKYDSEAIQVRVPGLGQVGYVANSVHTVIGDSMSAGRIYDKIGDTAKGKILYVLPEGALCELNPESVQE